MALSYILVPQLVPETPCRGFFVCLVGLGFLKVSLIWFNLLQLESLKLRKEQLIGKLEAPVKRQE